VVLDAADGFTRDSIYGVSSGFLPYAAVLPKLRSLTLHLLYSHEETPFWGRLNDAFPLLNCLVLTGEIRATAEEAVVFENLEILDIECQFPFAGVHFPVLRHASIKSYNAAWAVRWHGLESLLLPSIVRGSQVDWPQLPNLRLLGIPTSHISLILHCPRDHPLSKLCIFLPGLESTCVETTIERSPLSAPHKIRIHITSADITPREKLLLAEGCDHPRLELVGVPLYRREKDNGIFSRPNLISIIVLITVLVYWDLQNV
jgi:hypothetical protein